MDPLGPLLFQTEPIKGEGVRSKLIDFRENLGYLLPVKFYWHTFKSFRVEVDFAILNKSLLLIAVLKINENLHLKRKNILLKHCFTKIQLKHHINA